MTTRVIDSHTSALREACLVASLIDVPRAKWGRHICTAMSHAPTFWDDPIAGGIAVAILECTRRNRVPTLPLVYEFIDKKYRNWLFNPGYTDSYTHLETAEMEAEDLCLRYAGKRLQAVLGKAWNETKAHPERAVEIAKGVISTLKEFLP